MLTIKELTVKNFMSVGNQAQAINFANKNLVLVIGENMDLGGDDAGARNGTGKTTIINALSYVFFGEALTNIRRDNLVNKTLSLRGTSTGEHGIWLNKKKYLKKEHESSLFLMKNIKKALDPNNIMNPGKIFDL